MISKIRTYRQSTLFGILCRDNCGINQNAIRTVIGIDIGFIKIHNHSSSSLVLKYFEEIIFPAINNEWRFNKSRMILCMGSLELKSHTHNDGSRSRQGPEVKSVRRFDFFVDAVCNWKVDNIIQFLMAFTKMFFVFESDNFSRSYNTSTCCSA